MKIGGFSPDKYYHDHQNDIAVGALGAYDPNMGIAAKLGGGSNDKPIYESWGDKLGFGTGDQKSMKDIAGNRANSRNALHEYTTGTANKMQQADADTLNKQQGNVDKAKTGYGYYAHRYQEDQDALRQETDAARKNSGATYTSTIEPRMKNLMEDYGKDSKSAMSLEDSMDPNNKVHQANEDKYNRQAANEGRSGMAGVSMMQNLGAQNFSQQMNNGMPMTGGQMQSLMGANMGQAGQAMANVQKRQNNLRDQGIDRGYQQSDLAYDRGVGARNAYGQSINNYQNAGIANDRHQAGLRGESSGYGQNIAQSGQNQAKYNFGMDTGMTGMQHDYAQQDSARRLANEQQYRGGQIEDYNSQAKGAQSNLEAKRQRLSGLGGILGGIAGNSGALGGLGKFFGGGGGGSGASGKGSSEGDSAETQTDADGNPIEVMENYEGDQGASYTNPGQQGQQDNYDNSDNSGGGQQDEYQAPQLRGRNPYPRTGRRY